MVESDKRLLKAFPKPPMVVYRRPANLKDTLCRAKLPIKKNARMLRRRKSGFRRCDKPKCRLCPFTQLNPGQVREKVTFKHTGESIPIKSAMDCQTEGILYKLDCTVQGCNEICYVGESMKRAEERFVGHLNTINLDCYENSNLPVARPLGRDGTTAEGRTLNKMVVLIFVFWQYLP